MTGGSILRWLRLPALALALIATSAWAEQPAASESQRPVLDPAQLEDRKGRHPYDFSRDLERPRRDTAVRALDRKGRVDSVGRKVGASR